MGLVEQEGQLLRVESSNNQPKLLPFKNGPWQFLLLPSDNASVGFIIQSNSKQEINWLFSLFSAFPIQMSPFCRRCGPWQSEPWKLSKMACYRRSKSINVSHFLNAWLPSFCPASSLASWITQVEQIYHIIQSMRGISFFTPKSLENIILNKVLKFV